MQVFGLPRHITRTAFARWRGARANGLTAEQAARAVGISRATLYRWMRAPIPQSRRPHRCRKPSFTPALVQAVEELRADNPMWGKRKLAALLRREGVVVSTSTVGRILRKLMDKGIVTPVPTLRRNPGARRIRLNARQRYARRLPKGLKPTRPGEIVQIDTLFVNVRPDKAIKHFTAYDPVAKWTVGHVATRASAQSAKALLDKLHTHMPFRVSGIQVDGGSEFKAEFEQACADQGLTLFVLPPKSPKLNGAVERAQGSWRYEFYACFDLPHRIDKLQSHVDAFAHRYNHHRPHQALGDRTPAEYLPSISTAPPRVSDVVNSVTNLTDRGRLCTEPPSMNDVRFGDDGRSLTGQPRRIEGCPSCPAAAS